MIRNYFKIAYRILTRNKVFSLINIFGLSVALTSVLVIFLFISNELSFDKYHSNYHSIYKVVGKEHKNGRYVFDAAVPVPLSGVLKDELNGSKFITQTYFNHRQLLRINEEKYMQDGCLYVDTNFTKVFDVDFIIGNSSDFGKANSVYLTEKIAIKYFGSVQDAVGKEIVMMDSVSLNVAGVVKNPPKNTHMPYKLIISWETMSEKYFVFNYNKWGTRISGFGTYLTLNKNADTEKIEEQIKTIVLKHNPRNDDNYDDGYFLLPLKAIHFDDRFETVGSAYITSKKFIWIFTSVGLFILVIAFINFTNLSIVQTIKRAKEVGVRKVVGADRVKLVKQFLGETFLLLFIAEVLSLILTEVVIDKINALLGNGMKLELYGSTSIVVFLLLILTILTFLSGIYPAIVLSRYNPIKALRYNLKLGRKNSFSLYNLLVVFQFVISLVLIISAIVISLQIKYFKSKDLGFEKEYVYAINVPQGQVDKSNTLAELFKKNPKIGNVSLGIGAPMSGSNMTSSFHIPGVDMDYYANIKSVDTSYVKLYDLKLIAGSWFNQYMVNDSTYNIVVNKQLLKEIQVQNANDAIGKYLKIFGSLGGIIVGVTEDFHVYSLQNNIPPVIFMPWNKYFSRIHIKTASIPFSEVKKYIEESWNEVFPEYIFDYEIIDDTIQSRYSSEQRVADIVIIFTLIAIIIACLGLYGLVSFMLVQRTKEIGIRKAMGASIISLVVLVSKQFAKLVLVSCVFAWPIAYYLMNNWLKNYAYKIELGFGVFIVSVIILLLITFLTILYQSIKVSLTNPVEVLKYE